VALFFQNGGFEITSGDAVSSQLLFWLFFLGFGIKIPMWPFYYWLTKTHVEASSFFSMYLSGFLVKTAVFLFIKFYSLLSVYAYIDLFLALFVVGVVDSSIKMWHQVDLKKLIAYTTVQEMNFLCIPIL
jgi:NADH-quinone oxidoreductase subunit M